MLTTVSLSYRIYIYICSTPKGHTLCGCTLHTSPNTAEIHIICIYIHHFSDKFLKNAANLELFAENTN